MFKFVDVMRVIILPGEITPEREAVIKMFISYDERKGKKK